jgi:hypothetical protein
VYSAAWLVTARVRSVTDIFFFFLAFPHTQQGVSAEALSPSRSGSDVEGVAVLDF